MPGNAPEGIETVFEEICDPSQPLLLPRLIGGINDWKNFATFLGNRIKAALFAIQSHPTDAKMTMLHVGGELGLFPVLHMLEFLCCYTKTATLKDNLTANTDVEVLVKHAEVVLSREMWRHWAIASLVRIRHRRGEVVWLLAHFHGGVCAEG